MVKKIYVDGEIEDWSESDWMDYVEERAEKLAAQRIKQNRKYGSTPHEGDLEKYKAGFKEKMLRAYPFEKLDDKVYAAFENMGDEDGVKWLSGWKDKDPMAGLERAKLEKHLPLLLGVAPEGEDWYSMGAQKLRDIGGEMGYRTGTNEGFAEFLDTLGEYQKQLDRAKLVKEYRDNRGLAGTVESLVYPTRTKAIENAIATGGDLSTKDLIKLSLLDATIDAGQFAAPSLNVLKSRPVINAALDAGLQGGLEVGRQAGGNAIADVEPDYVTPPITSLTAGLTRPAMFGSTQGLLGGMTGPEWMKFRRGMMASTRSGNPLIAERNSLAKNIDRYNEGVLNDMKKAYMFRDFNEITDPKTGNSVNASEMFRSAFSDNGVDKLLSLADKDAAISANLAPQLREALEGAGEKVPLVKYSESGLDGKKGVASRILDKFRRKNDGVPVEEAEDYVGGQPYFIDKAALLDVYDRINPYVGVNTRRGITTVNQELPNVSTVVLKSPKDVENLKLSGKDEGVFNTLIPNKMEEMKARNWQYNLGLALGTGINDFGGRFEPTFKMNLLNPFQNSPFADDKEAYKKTQWYRNMTPKSRKIFDEAFKAKQAEEEE